MSKIQLDIDEIESVRIVQIDGQMAITSGAVINGRLPAVFASPNTLRKIADRMEEYTEE